MTPTCTTTHHQLITMETNTRMHLWFCNLWQQNEKMKKWNEIHRTNSNITNQFTLLPGKFYCTCSCYFYPVLSCCKKVPICTSILMEVRHFTSKIKYQHTLDTNHRISSHTVPLCMRWMPNQKGHSHMLHVQLTYGQGPHHPCRKSVSRVVLRFSTTSIWFSRSPRSVISARSIFHDRFSISASNWACWYSNWGRKYSQYFEI